MIVRKAKPQDVPILLELIKGLADYEKEPESVINTIEQLNADLFEHQYCEAIVAVEEDKIIGFALYYTSYSTWKGACIYLEDIFIIPDKRRNGVGTALFDELVSIAKNRGVARMDWQILEWNTLAIDFYKKKGATLDNDWLNGRLFFK